MGGASARNATSRFAVVDVGSNTVHLLIADSDGHSLAAVDDQNARLRLGADVAQDGVFQRAKMQLATETVQAYVERAARAGANAICLLGTQAVRMAANGQELAGSIERATSLALRVIDPGTEAHLGYLGTTLDVPDKGAHLVVDVGGGSTQLSFAKGRRTCFLGAFAIGSAVLPTRFIRHDPPLAAERQQLAVAVHEAIGVLNRHEDGAGMPQFGVLIGGVGRRLKRAGRLGSKEPLERVWVERLANATMAASADMMDVFGAVRLEDADMVRAGALVLWQVMAAFDLQRCFVSDNGIREGAVLALARDQEIPDGD